MLQTYKSPSAQVGEDGSIDDVPYSVQPSLTDLYATLIGFLRRQFPVVLWVVLLTIGLAVAYLFTTPPLYSAQAKLMIDTGKVQVLKQSILSEGDPFNFGMIDGQIEILKSENFALKIVKNLHLAQDPEFIGPARGLIGTARNVIRNLFIANKNEPKSESDLTLQAVRVFEDRLTASRVGITYVIEISFKSFDPDRAPQIANAVADGFIVDQFEAKYQTIRGATAWLQDRLNELQGQAAAAEGAVIDYKTKNNIVDTGGRLINEQELAQTQQALTQARAATAEAQARLDRVTQVLRDDNLDPKAATAATVTEALQNPIITQLRQQYLDLAQREAIFSSRYGDTHLAVVNLRNRMQEIRHSIVDELNRIAAAYKSDYDIAKARENSLEQTLATTVAGSQTTNKAQIELRQLERAAQTYRALYDSFQQRYMDSVQQQSLPMTEARVITRASQSVKSSPKSLIILGGATFGGLVLGFGLAMLRELADQVFRTGKQVEARLKTECLAIVPLIKQGAKAAPVSNKPAAGAASRIIAPNAGLLRNVIDAPLSPFAESIRAVKVSVDVNGAGKPNKVIGITSSHPNEGKSTIAASLAQLTADGGARVILVDCDLRKPSLSRQLVPDATRGLIDVITNKASLDQVIWYDRSTRLSFLPAGVKSHLIHTSEILASDAMKGLFARLRENYGYVIVDLSPVTPVVDVRAATHLVDTFLFVIQWGKTKIDVAEHALNTARGVYDNLLGVVLNKVDLKALNRYEGHGNYYYSRHYAHYGYTD
jgi:succinoglycan biosynthesis transport protein ExoP